ncbi:hypothetical protein AVEN_136792-1 [Araneus ventricosus]|uniref:ATP-dependent DNA helicase PIF1 n=1 Tax=Araneus ventricosus TaxID=182803 RepID=A0A4Y2N3J5_ARAVE|nr:hypothetical protein AVEN_136792-1 [Araneus ventricosus]
MVSECNRGDVVFLPRIELAPSDVNLPFVLKHRQFPLIPAYAMTINKSQGQTFDHVRIYLDPCFISIKFHAYPPNRQAAALAPSSGVYCGAMLYYVMCLSFRINSSMLHFRGLGTPITLKFTQRHLKYKENC